MPIQHFTKQKKEQLDAGHIPEDWSAAKRRQKDLDATHTEGNTGANVYADRGYPSLGRSQMLAALGYHDHIQRKGHAGKPLSPCQQGRNAFACLRVREW